MTTYEWRFHGPASLTNDADGTPYTTVGANVLHVPQTLGSPYLRFGHEFDILGRPMEFSGGTFFGRFTIPERSSPSFTYPGSGWAPFDGSAGPAAYASANRRGVDLMLSNVHSFDIKVWDDIIGAYVDLGHDEPPQQNPYVVDASGNHPVQEGFYHESRLRDPFPQGTLAQPDEDFYFDHPSVDGNFGNRYDTWSPRMFIADGDPNVATTQVWRTGRAPYRPQWTNPDPNNATFNDPPTVPVVPSDPVSVGRESLMAFGDRTLDDDGDGLTMLDLDGNGSADDPTDTDAEAPLRAIQIVVRYLDSHSGQMRQATIETSLID